MYITLKLDASGYMIHSISDGDEIVVDGRYVVMPWKMISRGGTSMTLEEAVEEIEDCEKERKLVSEFESEHIDEINEMQGLIVYMDEGYV